MPSQGSRESRRYVIFADKLMHELRFRAERAALYGRLYLDNEPRCRSIQTGA
jgi:hypothetical protein